MALPRGRTAATAALNLLLLGLCFSLFSSAWAAQVAWGTAVGPATGPELANVTVEQVTLLKQFSWFTAPHVYVKCDDGNSSEVPAVKSARVSYNFSGTEDWQPVIQLAPRQCKECGVREHVWFGEGLFASFVLCPDNFSDVVGRDAVVSVVEQGVLHLSLACKQCNTPKFRHPPGFGGQSTVTPNDLVVFFWLAVGVAALGVMLIVVGMLVYVFGPKEEDDEDIEKRRFIDRHSEDEFSAALRSEDEEGGEGQDGGEVREKEKEKEVLVEGSGREDERRKASEQERRGMSVEMFMFSGGKQADEDEGDALKL